MRPAWHLVTGEYPPASGGVSDYTRLVAGGLAGCGEPVHVWCPEAPGAVDDIEGVSVHRSAGCWTPADIERFDVEIERTPLPRRLLVQWVPHAFGRRSMNIGFCRWIARRARRGDQVDLMVHEPFLPFREGALRHDLVAGVHRLMAAMLLRSARKVWVAIPAWAARLRPWAFGRGLEFCWLPVPSTLPVAGDPRLLERTRTAVRRGAALVAGHLGTYDAPARRQLGAIVPAIVARLDVHVILLGRGSDDAATALVAAHPGLAGRLIGTGSLAPHDLSAHLQACDLLVQPYVDGASTRRTTLMAAFAHGVPVVTTIGRLSEPLWQDSPAVTAVSAGDTHAVAGAVARLGADQPRRRRQADLARDLYASRFAPSRLIERLREDRCEPAA